MRFPARVQVVITVNQRGSRSDFLKLKEVPFEQAAHFPAEGTCFGAAGAGFFMGIRNAAGVQLGPPGADITPLPCDRPVLLRLSWL